MRILSIETSCDETALSITEEIQENTAHPQIRVLAHQVLSQIEIHKEYGGVFPAIAKREHAKALVPLFLKVCTEAGVELKRQSTPHEAEKLSVLLTREPELLCDMEKHILNISTLPFDAIALTTGPGLEPALWVGINFAKSLSLLFGIPILPVNHMEGHLLASAVSSKIDEVNSTILVLDTIEYPAIGLLVSGGHTELILIKKEAEYTLLGETLDDAVGEAFDKVARLLHLPYPGGPAISKLAEDGEPHAIKLPRPMLHSGDYHFSFSGLKTAVRYLIEKSLPLTDELKKNIARDFEDACVEVITKKTLRAVSEFSAKTVIIGGGVSANKKLIRTLKGMLEEIQVSFLTPDRGLSTDNALMIGIAAHIHPRAPMDSKDIIARGQWRIHQ